LLCDSLFNPGFLPPTRPCLPVYPPLVGLPACGWQAGFSTGSLLLARILQSVSKSTLVLSLINSRSNSANEANILNDT